MSTVDGRLYRTARWARCRHAQLSREPMCQGCETKPAEHVDHIKPVSQGGAFWQSSNWQSLCPGCHSEKTARDKIGATWTPPKWRGCFPDGSPRDPNHPWFKGDGGRSITGTSSPRTDDAPENRIS